MPPRSLILVALVIGSIVSAAPAQAHGDVPGRIHELGHKMELQPKDIELRFARGELHLVHEDWDQAADDFEAARKLAAATSLLHRLATRLLADAHHRAGRSTDALSLLTPLLSPRVGAPKPAAKPPASRADKRVESLTNERLALLRLRGQILMDLKRPAEAATDFRARIDLLHAHNSKAGVSDFRYLGRAYRTAKKPELALRTYREGVDELGSLVTLVQPAVALLEEHGKHADALKWSQSLPPLLLTSPRWALRRATSHQKVGDASAARDELQAALDRIDGLPDDRRMRPRTVTDRTQIVTRLAALADAAVVAKVAPEARATPRALGWLLAAAALAMAFVAYRRGPAT